MDSERMDSRLPTPFNTLSTGRVTFTLGARSFSYWSTASHGWKIAGGGYRILVGGSSRTEPLAGTLTLAAA